MVPIDERQEWQEESDELKQMVWKALEDWLEDSKVSELHKSHRTLGWGSPKFLDASGDGRVLSGNHGPLG